MRLVLDGTTFLLFGTSGTFEFERGTHQHYGNVVKLKTFSSAERGKKAHPSTINFNSDVNEMLKIKNLSQLRFKGWGFIRYLILPN